ncbi:hypothetical protein CHH83_02050 [Bacillus sp. 7586-K]|nr:hypothetical protein CHH83_02050 [Bacillus sp. 7586-K]
MKEYIITLKRKIGKGNDLLNFFENRGCQVIFEDREVLPKTIIIQTQNKYIKDLRGLKYVQDVKEVRNGTIFV